MYWTTLKNTCLKLEESGSINSVRHSSCWKLCKKSVKLETLWDSGVNTEQQQ